MPVAGEIWLVELGLNGWSSAAVNVLIRVAIPFSMVSVSGKIWDCWLEGSGVTSCWCGLVLLVIGETWCCRLEKSDETWGSWLGKLMVGWVDTGYVGLSVDSESEGVGAM